MKALQLEHPIDEHLKPIKDSDSALTSIEVSTTKLRVKDLEITGTATGSDIVLDADGVVKLDAASVGSDVQSIQFIMDGNTSAGFAFHHAGTYLTLFENGGASAVDYLQIACSANGATQIATNDAAGTDAHLTIEADGHVEFDGCATGFNREEATFSATGVIGSGGTDDTDIDFRLSNKFRLEMTGDIHTVNLIFPAVSGNFLLVCTTNGDHDVSYWKVWESDESAPSAPDVLWAGGSVPAFTSSGVDIVSFYWDADEQEAYGTASLAFAAP